MKAWQIPTDLTQIKAARGYAAPAVIAVVMLALVIYLAKPHSAYVAPPDPPLTPEYKLVFMDHFDTLDLARGGADRKPHTWYPGVWWSSKKTALSNIAVNGSILSLTWNRNQAPGTDTQTTIATLSPDKLIFKAWRYGYFEARMRWDVVKGAWPAFWLISVQDATGQNVYNGTKRAGEIDVFEGQGAHPKIFYGTIHEWINSHTDHPSRDNAFQLPEGTDMSQFHTYGLLWTPGKVTWYFDDLPLHTEPTPEVFDKQDYFLVLTMQEGVDWTGDDLSGVTAPRMTLNVDWVKVWQKQ